MAKRTSKPVQQPLQSLFDEAMRGVDGDAVVLYVRLPYPPSANRLWANFRGHVVKTAEAREYSKTCAELVRLAGGKLTEKAVVVNILVERPRRVGDLDNRLRAVLDALNGLVYSDDDQVVGIVATRIDRPGDGGVWVTVREVDDGAPVC